MGKQENFTAERVAAFKCEPSKQQSIYWDGKADGFGLRVTAAGTKSYIFETRLHGKTLRMTIGSPVTWPLESQWREDKATGKKEIYRLGARDKARQLKALTDQGIDPRLQAAEQRSIAEAAQAAAKRKTTMVGDAWAVYLAHHKDKMSRPHIERGKRWGTRHLTDHERLAQAGGEEKKRGTGLKRQGVLYPLLQMRMSDITAEVLKDWQKQEAETRPNNARQGFEMFRAFWRWCALRPEYTGLIDTLAVESKDLRDEVPSRKSKKFDVLERGHLPAWFAAVRGLSNPVISTYLQALILTGARREEMAGLRWQDVDFQWNSIWVKDKVAEEGRKIPLTPYMRSLLLNLKRINDTPPTIIGIKDNTTLPDWKPSPWVFWSKSAANGRIAEPRIPHNRALSIAGLPPLTLHGLRRTFASLAEWVEMPRGIVAKIMGHAPSATAEKHYIDRPLELLAVWHCRYEAWILEQAGIVFGETQEQTALRVISIAHQ